MAPLILHNVPDDELYIGDDGIQRPYAMIFPGTESTSRSRRAAPETGSFGKSTRRSRSRTGTPGPKAAREEDPNIVAADAIFSAYLAKQAATAPSDATQRARKASIPSSASNPNLSLSTPLDSADSNVNLQSARYIHKEPTEVILRGFKSTHQYAAIREYERIGGLILEDYPRDPPLEQRKYKSDLRDPATLRRRALTQEEKAKALRFAGGEHWIKITFESAEAAEVAVDSSPQNILGYMVSAELYRGVPPTDREAVPAAGPRTVGGRAGERFTNHVSNRTPSTLPRSFTTPSMSQIGRGGSPISPPGSLTSTQTLDTTTLSTTSGTASNSTLQPQSNPQPQPSSQFCQRIPTARRIQLLPAEQALLPQKSYSQRLVSNIPLIGWLSSDIIGNQVPRTESGEFDWGKASLYWRVIYWVDTMTGWFDIVGGDKED